MISYEAGRAKKTSWWTIVLVPLGLVAVMTPAVVLAAGGSGGGFDDVVSGIEQRYHVHANKIPFMGLVSFVAGRATHGGVHGLHVAEIERFDGPVDGEELTALVQKRAGNGWSRMIRETGRGGDQSLIYIRSEKEHIGMLIVDLNGHEMDIVQISVNPDQLAEQIKEHHHGKGHDADSDDDKKDDAKDNDDGE
jgi:hypothetical protein